MIPNPIRKVLSSMRTNGVQILLMGGQACVLYGAAEFSRDLDCSLHCGEDNLARLQLALQELQAENIAVPPFTPGNLHRGFAIHFRCHHPDCDGLRLDLMAKMRGVDEFSALWERRTVVELTSGEPCDVMGIADLVKAKKTRRDKDWPMITRLVAEHYYRFLHEATSDRLDFWLLEGRTPTILQRLAKSHPEQVQTLVARRPLLAFVNDLPKVEFLLREEEIREREADQQYWNPLLAELEELRRTRRNL